MRILAVGAHPDDLEQLCGGTIARYVDEGHPVTMCHVSKGDRGSFTHTSEQISAIRHDEAARSAAILGAEHISLGLSDGEVNAADPAQRRLVVELVRQVRPDVVLTHAPNDYMPDHNEVCRLVEDSTFVATLPLYTTSRSAHSTVSAVFHMDTLAGSDFTPLEYVDISIQADRKIQALEAHQSQLSWLRDHDGVDIVEQTRVLGRLRGFQSGVTYAEGFRPNLRWLRARTTRMLP